MEAPGNGALPTKALKFLVIGITETLLCLQSQRATLYLIAYPRLPTIPLVGSGLMVFTHQDLW